MHDILYVKFAVDRYHTFEKRTCILTRSGLFCILNKNGKIDFYSHLTDDEYFVYSGDTCCSYIQGLPLELPCRLFGSGMIIEQNARPNQCCFVVRFPEARKEYIFLTKTQSQKEDWVRAITN